MTRTRFLLAMAAVILVGCGGGASHAPLAVLVPTSTTAAAVTASGPVPSTAFVSPTVILPGTTRPRTGGPIVVTLTSANDAQSVPLRVGDSVELLLDDPTLQWTNVTVDRPELLRTDPAPSPPPSGQLRIWTAVAPGTVNLSAVGTARCAAGVACPMFARLFRVALVVT